MRVARAHRCGQTRYSARIGPHAFGTAHLFVQVMLAVATVSERVQARTFPYRLLVTLIRDGRTSPFDAAMKDAVPGLGREAALPRWKWRPRELLPSLRWSNKERSQADTLFGSPVIPPSYKHGLRLRQVITKELLTVSNWGHGFTSQHRLRAGDVPSHQVNEPLNKWVIRRAVLTSEKSRWTIVKHRWRRTMRFPSSAKRC